MRARSYLIAFAFIVFIVAALAQWAQRSIVAPQTAQPRAPATMVAQQTTPTVSAQKSTSPPAGMAQASSKQLVVPSNTAVPPTPSSKVAAAAIAEVGDKQAPAQPARIAAVVASPSVRALGIEGLALRLSRPLMFDLPRVQGLAADAQFFYIAAADAKQEHTILYQVYRSSYSIAKEQRLQPGGKNVLGGMHMGSEFLWAPLAQKDVASSLVLAIDPKTLEVRRSFSVPDRIRAVAQGQDGHIYGFNYGSSFLYEWSIEGKMLRKSPCAAGVQYQDMEIVRGSLVCTGMDQNGSIVIDIIDPASLSLLARRRGNALSRAQNLVTRAGFAFFNGEFYFLPDEGTRPMLMTYVLEGTTLEAYVPSTR